MFTGSVIMLRIGFIVRKRNARDAPPMISVRKPPSIFIPGIKYGRRNNDNVYIATARIMVFMRLRFMLSNGI